MNPYNPINDIYVVFYMSLVFYFIYTGCGKKNSPIWEANKFKTKEDTANVFFISGKYTECCFTSACFKQNITQVAAFNIDTLM